MAPPQCQFKTTGGGRKKWEMGRLDGEFSDSQILSKRCVLTSFRNARAIEFYFVQLDWMSECSNIMERNCNCYIMHLPNSKKSV